MKVTHAVWRDLAGPVYDKLMASKEEALKYIDDNNPHIRISAINICDSVWKCTSDKEFIDACRRLATNDDSDAVRVHAIGVLGKAYRSTKDISLSTFLANVATNAGISEQLRMAAYWALREVQFGMSDGDAIKRTIALAKKTFSSALLTGSTGEQIQRALLCGERFPAEIWDAADRIDWSIVDQFASKEL